VTQPSPGRGGLLDTSTLILLARIDDAVVLPDEPSISTITLAELSVGPLVARTDEERAARQAHLQQAEADFDPLHSTPMRPGPSGESQPHCTEQDARRRLVHTTP